MRLASDRASVVVWGGGTGGVAAAIQAARGGSDVLLLTPGSWLGGMVSAAGVCCPDGNELSPWQTGLWGAFLRALQRQEPLGLDHNWVSCFGYRPTTAEGILQQWVRGEPRLRWWPDVQIQAVQRQGTRISAVEVCRGSDTQRVELEVLIDGSDLGDLLPLAQVPYRWGWEAQECWGEPSAPAQSRLDADPFFRRHPVQSPTWVVMGQLQDGSAPATPGGAPELPAPFSQACQAFGLERTLTYGRLPGGLVMLNWPLHGNDWHGGLERAFSGTAAETQALAQEMQAHSLAFAASLGQASDGWLTLGDGFPHDSGAPAPWLAAMPYWREGRRLMGREVVIEQDLLPRGPGEAIATLPLDTEGRVQSIAVGNYANDHHYPGPDWPLAAKSCRWGGRWSGTPFCIPYGALLSDAVENLLVADKAISTSHMANGATRLQPLVFNVGQAAGAAAALALQRGQSPQELPVEQLQQVLLDDPLAPAAVVPLWDTPWHHSDWRRRQRLVLQDPALVSTAGQWLGAVGLQQQEPMEAPCEPHEDRWSGTVIADGEGGYTLELAGGQRWSLITLEPALHRWLQQLDRPRSVALIGCANPWGPWLRVSRLA